MTDNVLLIKLETIERCIARARDDLGDGREFATDYRRQDSAVLNIHRACDAAIDMAFRLVRQKGIGLPANNGEAFRLLQEAGLLPSELASATRRMTGFRNVAVHRYRNLDLVIVKEVIQSGLDDLAAFAALAIKM